MPALDRAWAIVASPDGRSVYAITNSDEVDAAGGIVAFARDALTGRLHWTACATARPTEGCTTMPELRGATSLAVSRDGGTVYVGGIDLVALRHDRSTGALSLAACAAPAASPAPTCTGPRLARDALGGIALSPDGRSAYAANFSGDELSGVGTPLGTGGSAACLASFALQGCRGARGRLDAPVMSGDGRFVYTSGSSGGDGVAITVLRRSPSGTVAMSSCVAEWDDPDPTVPPPDRHCAVGYPAADDPDRIAISADGRFAYTASADRNVVSVLRRDARTGGLRPYQSAAGCVSSDGTAVDRLASGDAPGPRVCRIGRGISAARDVVLSPDRRFAYVAAPGSDAVAVFATDGPRLRRSALR